MSEPALELKWVMDDSEEDPRQDNLLAIYYREVANGPMTDYRHIIQGGQKQGQNYYTHVLDGINILHTLRSAGVIEMNDLEERLLFTAETVHDLNKIPPYGGRDVELSYVNIATCQNISDELKRLDMMRFFYDWPEYIEDIRLLMLLHQHDAAPLGDLDQRQQTYVLRYERLRELGKLLYAVDNLNLSHTLTETKHKQNFVMSINAVAEKRWRWVKHHLGENRAVFSNIIHNTVISYLKDRHTHDDHSAIADLLYYPDGVAYLLAEPEEFSWSDEDTEKVAQRLAQAIVDKQMSGLYQFIKPSTAGIKVSQAAIDSEASYTDIMYVIRHRVDRKGYSSKKMNDHNQNLRTDIEKTKNSSNQFTIKIANDVLNTQPIIPLEQELFKRGEIIFAYYNFLRDHGQKVSNKRRKFNVWEHIYTLLDLPLERYALYEYLHSYRRGYFIANDCKKKLDTIFEIFLADVAKTSDVQIQEPINKNFFRDYLATNLEFSESDRRRDFAAHLQQYIKADHKQCCMCSSSLSSVELMSPEVPSSMGVQMFSNRLKGGSREPKRNVCPICRVQLVLEKLTRVSFNRNTKQKTKNGEKKNSELYTNFYLHLYPYAFFTSTYTDTLYTTLKEVCHEDNQCFFLDRERYFRHWEAQLTQGLSAQASKQAQQMTADENKNEFETHATKVNGVSIPQFSDTVCNTPTLPLNAPGENYNQQFLFALTHALMIADFFGCRVALSRMPTPLLSDEYMAEHELTFFADSIPLNLRWLLPTNEYRSLETYRERQKDGGPAYSKRRDQWQQERPDDQGYAARENISRRLSILYRLAQQLDLRYGDAETFLLEIARAMADDPLSVYRVVDLTIEQQVRQENSTKKSSKKPDSKARKSNTKSSAQTKNMPPELRAIILSKRVTALLDEIVKE